MGGHRPWKEIKRKASVWTGVRCPYCDVQANYVDSAVVYNGRSFGMIYLCPNYPECDARVGVETTTGRPLGTLARHELRELRKACHERFDTLWQGVSPMSPGSSPRPSDMSMTRSEAYSYLRKLMGLSAEEAHIGQFDEQQCGRFLKRWGCQTCREYPGEPGPSHDGSKACRNMRVLGHGAIAAGGP